MGFRCWFNELQDLGLVWPLGYFDTISLNPLDCFFVL